MLARQGVAVNRKGAELYVNTMKPPETDVISRYAGERLVEYNTFPALRNIVVSCGRAVGVSS